MADGQSFIPQNMAPAPLAMPPRKKAPVGWIMCAVVVVLLLGVGIYFSFFQPYYSRLVHFWFFDVTTRSARPSDLKDISFLLAPKNGGGIYKDGSLDFTLFEQNHIVTTEIAKADGHQAILGANSLALNFSVIKDGVIATSSASWKQHIALSPDGSMLLYAVPSPQVEGGSAEWLVFILDKYGVHTLAKGYAGLFVDNQTVLSFSQNKVVTYALKDKQALSTMVIPLSSSAFSLAQSPDRTLFATHEANGPAYVYKLTGTAPPLISSVGTTTPENGALALTKDALYVTNLNDTGSMLWRYPLENLENGTRLWSFPTLIRIANIIP